MGIDVSKDSLDISFGGKYLKIGNNKTAIKNFLKTAIDKKIAIRLCVLESTGGYEKLAIGMLDGGGIKVHRAHPNKVYAFAKASGHFAKTDKLDSKLLEKYAEFIKDEELPAVNTSKTLLELQELRSVEKDLEKALHAQTCRAKLLSGKALDYTKKRIRFIKKQLAQIQEDIEKVINSDKELEQKQKTLISYKGVGKKTANSLIAELPELGTLSNKKVASLVGIAPKTNESGKKVGKGHIAGGRFFVRKALYMAALVAAYSNNKMKKFYQELLNKGKAKKVALTAVMRKIIVCLNSMVKNNKLYEI